MMEFKMPSLGADMDAGTLIAWHVKPGQKVSRGDIIAEVETDKGIIEVEIWQVGSIAQLLVEPGQKIPVGTVLAYVRAPDEMQETEPSPAKAAIGAESSSPSILEGAIDHTAPQPLKIARASPLAKKTAEEYGIDLNVVHGSGPFGSIVKADLDSYLASKQNPPIHEAPIASTAPDKIASMRQAIAAAMSRSKREIPHYYLQTDVNLQKALAWLETSNQDRPLTERLLPAVLFMKAIALACQKVPEMNGHWIDGEFHPSSTVNLGVAISLRQGGLIAPAIHEVETKTLVELMRGMLDLVKRVRSGKLRSSEISDSSITLSNLGDQGVASVFGVIYPPQVALVGFGKIMSRPWAEQQWLGVAPIVSLCLSADHRVSDGHRGGIFMNHIARCLEEPERLQES